MHGFVQSFNVNISVAMCLYHIQHVLGLCNEGSNLEEDEAEELRSRFLIRNCLLDPGKPLEYQEFKIKGLADMFKRGGIDFGEEKIKEFIK